MQLELLNNNRHKQSQLVHRLEQNARYATVFVVGAGQAPPAAQRSHAAEHVLCIGK